MVQANKPEAAKELSLSIQACGRCPYSKSRACPIAGQGDPRAPILVIGETARQVDDSDGAPFGGRAGKKFESWLEKAEMTSAHVYTTLAVKCYGGREPTYPAGAAAKRCRQHLVSLMKIMKPRAVVLCGVRALKWVLLRWTSESVDEKTFYKWVGRAFRLKEVWGDTKFFVIHSPPDLASERRPEDEDRSVQTLSLAKAYVVSQQRGAGFVLQLSDLKRRRPKGQQVQIKWNNPEALNPSKLVE